MRHNRESRQQLDESDGEVDFSETATYMEEALSRRAATRSHGLRKVAELSKNHMQPISDEQVDELLPLIRQCTDPRLPLADREALVRIAAGLMLNDRTDASFATDFAVALVEGLPSLLKSDEDTDALVTAMMHSIVAAQALEGNQIAASSEAMLSSQMLATVAPPKNQQAAAAAVVRGLAATCAEETDAAALGGVIRNALRTEDAEAAIQAVRAATVAFAQHGNRTNLTLADVEPLNNLSSKAASKDTKKELAQVVRAYEELLETRKEPSATLNLTLPHSRGLELEVEVTGFVPLVQLESIRFILENEYYHCMLTSTSLRTLFEIEVDDQETIYERLAKHNRQDREARYDRMVATKERAKGRERARDRKRNVADDTEQ